MRMNYKVLVLPCWRESFYSTTKSNVDELQSASTPLLGALACVNYDCSMWMTEIWRLVSENLRSARGLFDVFYVGCTIVCMV